MEVYIWNFLLLYIKWLLFKMTLDIQNINFLFARTNVTCKIKIYESKKCYCACNNMFWKPTSAIYRLHLLISSIISLTWFVRMTLDNSYIYKRKERFSAAPIVCETRCSSDVRSILYSAVKSSLLETLDIT